MSTDMSKSAFVRSLTAKAPANPGTIPTFWVANHNRALVDWLNGMVDRPDEAVVLNMAYGIWTLCTSRWGDDGFVEEHVTIPVMSAFHDLLNIEMGRLDGGTFSAWLVNLATVLDIEEGVL